ncbi:protein of unknown function [Nitrosotalea devaniterrae]|uniref:Uncharacterized protein n=1 Tax=Nitrosotalea devaniterrae TaxID=1078905 RepID=A0A128A378_9ARCH|nr:protein of unknown function [Candidatus Nitrosotalea devanaterra]
MMASDDKKSNALIPRRMCRDTNPKKYLVTYDGGVMGNDVILVCEEHITKHPFNEKILSKEIIEQNLDLKRRNP